jgi:glutamate racemase
MNNSEPSVIAAHNPTQPIGIFDSGVGGISVLKHIHALLPAEHLLYYADSLHAPYGSKTPEFICERAFAITDFLITQNAKALVVACNTATAAAVDKLRAHYTLPIIGMEPAVKPAAAASQNGVIGVLATVGTLKSAQFAALLEHYGQHVRVVTQACPGLVECIERGELKAPTTRQLVAGYVTPLLDAGVDTIVLGCTHYPFVRDLIAEIAGPKVALIDTGAAVARQLMHRLEDTGMLAAGSGKGDVKFWTNSPAPNAEQVIASLWGGDVEVVRV